MTASLEETAFPTLGGEPDHPAPVVAVRRRTIDTVLVTVGVVLTVVFLVAGALLAWGWHFSNDYVRDELASQNVSFPGEQELIDGGREDLVKYADQRLDTGREAQAYASFIDGHLQEIAGGATYAEMAEPETAAEDAVKAAVDDGRPQAEIDGLQAEADAITAQRDTLFQGETLRGLLLSAYAWSTVGMIAGISAIAAFVAAAMMLVLVILGMIHHSRTPKVPELPAS